MILESEEGSFTNEYGYTETYTKKQLTAYLSGHMHRGSAYESDDDCGNCSGARCAQCRKHYVVTIFNQPRRHPDGYMVDDISTLCTFHDLQEAVSFYMCF